LPEAEERFHGGQLADAAKSMTAEELREDPHDLIANLLLHGLSHGGSATTSVLAAYVLLHGVVKIAIIVALTTGSLKVYPWAIGALTAFLVLRGYQLITQPSIEVVVLTVADLMIVLLTWREWAPRAHVAHDVAECVGVGRG
jgi:uncharacterized membrane protein